MITPSGKIGTIDSLRNYSTDGLILNVDFSNDYGFAGNTANDLVNTAVNYSTPNGYLSVVSGSTATPGYIDLDGFTDYLAAGITTADFAGITSCTFDVWIKPDVISNVVTTIVTNTTTTIGLIGFGLNVILSTGILYPRFAVTSASGNLTTAQLTGLTFSPGTITPAFAEWINLFLRVNHTSTGITVTGKVFKPSGISASDYTGVTVTTAGITMYGNTDRAVHIGRRTSAAQYFNGQIGSVKIYNRVLSTDEIEFNYNTSRTRYGHT